MIPRSPERLRGYRPGINIPAQELRWIEVAAGLFKQYHSADVVALRLAAAGFPLHADAVKKALLDYFENVIVRRERSDAWAYRRTARGRGSVAQTNAAIAADYHRLGAEPPESKNYQERPVEAHRRHRRDVLENAESAKVGKVAVVGLGDVPAAVTIDEARRAIVKSAPSDVISALRATDSPEAVVDYLGRGLVQLYRDALNA
jgi:hypothetical protein